MKSREHKYNAQKTTITLECGKKIKFDSKLEYECYLFLKSLMPQYIKNITLKEKITAYINSLKVFSIIPDFKIELHNGEVLYIDSKGVFKNTQITTYRIYNSLGGRLIYIWTADTKQNRRLVNKIKGIQEDEDKECAKEIYNGMCKNTNHIISKNNKKFNKMHLQKIPDLIMHLDYARTND